MARQERFLGLPVTVVDDDDIAQEAAQDDTTVRSYIVMRVEDDVPAACYPQLKARRLRTLCEKCGKLCYIDPKCMETFRSLPMEIICLPCFLKSAGKSKIEASTSQTTLDEVRSNLGKDVIRERPDAPVPGVRRPDGHHLRGQ